MPSLKAKKITHTVHLPNKRIELWSFNERLPKKVTLSHIRKMVVNGREYRLFKGEIPRRIKATLDELNEHIEEGALEVTNPKGEPFVWRVKRTI